MDEILLTARDLEFEVNEDDIEELIMGHEDELRIEELREILNEEHQETHLAALSPPSRSLFYAVEASYHVFKTSSIGEKSDDFAGQGRTRRRWKSASRVKWDSSLDTDASIQRYDGSLITTMRINCDSTADDFPNVVSSKALQAAGRVTPPQPSSVK
ncbi:hypothetical protein TNCV_3911061 [Trichonephila clavipes]|nr:hypothetical protein TNCV_3911061 [Trichonephila clavipes]